MNTITLTNRGVLVLSKPTAVLMTLSKNVKLMASFNYSEKRVVLYKDQDPDEDSINVNSDSNGTYSIQNKDLVTRLVNCFDLKVETIQKFSVLETDKGFQIKPIYNE